MSHFIKLLFLLFHFMLEQIEFSGLLPRYAILRRAHLVKHMFDAHKVGVEFSQETVGLFFLLDISIRLAR